MEGIFNVLKERVTLAYYVIMQVFENHEFLAYTAFSMLDNNIMEANDGSINVNREAFWYRMARDMV